MAKAKRFWTVTINFRWTDISFQFTDAEQAAIFAEKAMDNFAPHYSDYFTGNAPELKVNIALVSEQENADKKVAFDNAMKPQEKGEENQQ